MIQKLFKVGSSAAVTISKKSLQELGLRIGDSVQVKIDQTEKVVSIQPTRKFLRSDKRIANLTLDFINRYRKDLEALAKK